MDDADPESKHKVLNTRFPLFVIRTEWLASPDSIAPVWEYLAWSCNIMHQGVYPASGFNGRPPPRIPCWGMEKQAPGGHAVLLRYVQIGKGMCRVFG